GNVRRGHFTLRDVDTRARDLRARPSLESRGQSLTSTAWCAELRRRQRLMAAEKTRIAADTALVFHQAVAVSARIRVIRVIREGAVPAKPGPRPNGTIWI